MTEAQLQTYNSKTSYATQQPFVIIFFDNSIKWVNEKMALELFDAQANGVKYYPISQSESIAVSAVSKILSEREYNEQYPLKENNGQIVKDNYPTFDWQKINRKNALTQMLKGVKKFISECDYMPAQTIELKDEMENKYEYIF